MRRRLVLSTILVVTIVLLILTVPVTLMLREAATNELSAQKTQEAATVAAALAGDLATGGPLDLADTDAMLAKGGGVRVLDANGTVIAERNVDGLDSPYRSSINGPNGTQVEVFSTGADINRRFVDQLVRLLFVALFAVVAAAALAFVQARQLGRQLDRLARSATRLGDDDFTGMPPSASGIAEIDGVARAIRLSEHRVERMLESERGFTADATHQLRTGLTGVAMRLEILERHNDPGVAHEAATTLIQIHELNTTLDELLQVARKGSTGERKELDITALVDHHVTDWQGQFARKRRQIVVTTGIVQPVLGTPGLIGQILNVLIENSIQHGRGTVAILVSGTSVSIEDEGYGIDEPNAATIFDRPSDYQAAHGRGLSLARRLAGADGGRLELVALQPTTFRLSLLSASG